MDTELLRTFIEVSKTRHFGRAAENLFLTQSAVSFRIRQLENQLGNPLFSRQRGNIHLTQAGERLVPYAETILQTWGRARQDIALSELNNVQLSIGASPLFWEFDGISDWISRIYQTVEGLAIRLDSVPRKEMSKQILEHQIDIAITSEPPRGEHLGVRNIQDYPLILVTSQPNVTLKSSLSHPLILLDWGTRFAMEQARVQELNRTPILHTHSPKMALDFIIANGGVGYLPEPVVQSAIDEGQCYIVEDAPVSTYSLFLVWSLENEKHEIIDKLTHVEFGFEPRYLDDE